MNLFKEINRIFDEEEKIRSKIRRIINSIPQNPKIKQLPGKVLSFVIVSDRLQGNWTSEFHDFRMQKDILKEIVTHTPFTNLEVVFRTLIHKGSIRWRENICYIHPWVVGFLKKNLQDGLVKP